MAFKLVVVAALVALVSAGYDPNYMNFMNQMMSQMNQYQGGHQQSGGCNPMTGGGCQIPAGVDVGDWLEQQKEQQQYESKQMAEKVKAQFESMMKEVVMKKHKYAMGIMTEYTALCACTQSVVNIYQTMFVDSAKSLNLTGVVDLYEMNWMPYQAKTAKEARELIFAGMVNALCTSLGTYMEFAQRVENNIPIFTNGGGTTPSA